MLSISGSPASAINKNRCACCSKKLTLADFACGKCQIRYCGTHRLPESHTCAHDFKSTGREQLTKQLTRVVGDKIEHI
jgi:predicted nucleic acid binding AN1-type Zn finger protein